MTWRATLAFLQRCDGWLVTGERVAIVLLFIGLLGLGMAQVIWRNLLHHGIFWADEWLQHTVLWLGFLGASLATHERCHLRIDVLTHCVPARWHPWMAVMTDLAAGVLCVLLFQAAWSFVQDEARAGTRLPFGLATWIAQSIIPLGFLLMALRFVLRAVVVLPHRDPHRTDGI